MPLINRLKDVGESYADFLARTRGQEASAKDHLPENKALAKEIKMSNLYNTVLDDVKKRSFAEIDIGTLHGYEEVKSFFDDDLKVVTYERIGTDAILNVCEDAGAYWFTSGGEK